MTPPTYAGFGTRFVAVLIDFVILIIPASLLGFVSSGIGGMLIFFGYKILFEASAAQATPGKRAMGIMVTDMNGNRLDMKSASIRAVVSFLSGSLTACLGHIVALFTEKKQAAHDLMAESLVVMGETKAPLLESWMDTARELFAKSKSV